MPTPSEHAALAARPHTTPGVGRLASSDRIPVGGFTPGAILLDRYRIIGLLGRGGMGEVYRADDLKLGQPDSPAASAYGFAADQDLIDYVARHDTSPDRWNHLPSETIRF